MKLTRATAYAIQALAHMAAQLVAQRGADRETRAVRRERERAARGPRRRERAPCRERRHELYVHGSSLRKSRKANRLGEALASLRP